MSTLTVTENYADGSTLTAAQLSAANTSIETWANGNIDATNITAAAITESLLATGSVTVNKLGANAVTSAKLMSDSSTDANRAVTTDHIRDSAVTTAKINNSAVTTAKINDLGVTTGKINDLAVTTGKINDGAVTIAKMAAVTTDTTVSAGNMAVSTATTAQGFTSTTYGDVTNATCTITTIGRPVLVVLKPYDATNPSFAKAYINSGTKTYVQGLVKFVRTTEASDTTIAIHSFGTVVASAVASLECLVPISSFYTIDTPAAGEHTYSVECAVGAAGQGLEVDYCKLVAFEL